MSEIKITNWSLAAMWNNLAMKPEKPLRDRSYIYASEVGMPFCDRFLKMAATPYTNPPNERSRRKFLSGNMQEMVVKQILMATGLYEHDELKVDAQPYEDCLEIHGRMDFKTVGGYIDIGKAFDNLNKLMLPEDIYNIGKGIIESLEGVALTEKILELKSVSSFAMDKVERAGAAMPNHTLQAYHYQKNAGIDANICYVCRDDLRMKQFKVNAEVSEPLYRADLEQMTYYYRKGEMPPIEPLAKFDESIGKFSKNLGVEYSPYLSKLYGFESPEAYRDSVSFVEKWNRCLTRYAMVASGAKTPTGKPITITPKNKEVVSEISAANYDFDKLLEIKVNLGDISEEEETE